MSLLNPKIDGLFYQSIDKIDNRAVVTKDLFFDKEDLEPNGFGLGVVCRKPYKEHYNNDITDFEILQIYQYLQYSNEPNCYIKESCSYPRSNPQKKGYVYILMPLRDLKKGQLLTVSPNDIPFKEIKISSCQPLRSQPDYMERNYEQQSKQIVSSIYNDIIKVSNIVFDLYNQTIK